MSGSRGGEEKKDLNASHVLGCSGSLSNRDNPGVAPPVRISVHQLASQHLHTTSNQ